jgi:diguanylate cyclase (GGDEF)-like protein/PAS domain S-box-containing protein
MAPYEKPPTPGDGAQAKANLSQQPLRLHEAIRAREQLLHRLAEALPLGVLQSDAEGRIVYTNQKLHTILSTDRLSTVEEQFSSVLPADKKRMDEAFEAALRGGLDSDLEVRLSTSDEHGEKDLRQCTISLRALTADSGEITGTIACVVDVTESVRIREELRVRATFDEVTQCHNRASTMEALEMALTTSDERSQPAVIFVDLDRFKEINDRLGHAAGDELLGVVAKRLVSAVRGEDLVGRIGGDEFLVVCPGITSSAQAMQTAERVAETLRHEVRLKTKQVPCRASIGVAWAGRTGADADTLVSQADAAMYEAKRLGSERPVLYATSRVEHPHRIG